MTHSTRVRPPSLEELWQQTRTEVRARLARIQRGETTAPEQVVRLLRAFLADDTDRPERPR
jgi:hypothetical protein